MVEGALAVLRKALEKAGLRPQDLLGIGITNQRETVVGWDKGSGKPLAPAIVWQDRRTAARCRELSRAGLEAKIHEITGLSLDPYFSATKLEWLFRQEPGLLRKAERGEVHVGTVDSWLLFSLTGEHATDPTNACRTMLFDLHRLAWDQDLCRLFSVPLPSLPQVRPSLSLFGLDHDPCFQNSKCTDQSFWVLFYCFCQILCLRFSKEYSNEG